MASEEKTMQAHPMVLLERRWLTNSLKKAKEKGIDFAIRIILIAFVIAIGVSMTTSVGIQAEDRLPAIGGLVLAAVGVICLVVLFVIYIKSSIEPETVHTYSWWDSLDDDLTRQAVELILDKSERSEELFEDEEFVLRQIGARYIELGPVSNEQKRLGVRAYVAVGGFLPQEHSNEELVGA